jgi:hypothetical protein
MHDGGVVRREEQSSLETMAAETKRTCCWLIGFKKKKRLNRYNEWETIPDIVKKKNYQSFPRCVARKDLFCLVVEEQVDDGTGAEHEPERGRPSSYHVHWRGDVGLYAGDVGL